MVDKRCFVMSGMQSFTVLFLLQICDVFHFLKCENMCMFCAQFC